MAYKFAFIFSAVFLLSGCETLKRINEDLAAFNDALIGVSSGDLPSSSQQVNPSAPPGLSGSVDNPPPPEIRLPEDPRAKLAVDSAMPSIVNVLTIHSCVMTEDGMRRLNRFSVPGLNFENISYSYPNRIMRYNNKSRCVHVRSIDSFQLLAANTLSFRVVYFALDSEETVNFLITLRNEGQGRWLISQYFRVIP